ncbi:MAG: DNA-deoxyinosine glycosylase [Clostridia bacterium]|nr:DNA-deoxyinosine glycosylase [Clostridia bacterium]
MSGNIEEGLKPICNDSSKVLILGTFPGQKSICSEKYYTEPRNRFWKIVYLCFTDVDPDACYDKREKFILDKGIALWDVGKTCKREGCSSSDRKSKITSFNKLKDLIEGHPNIELIILNGKTSTKKYFYKYAKENLNIKQNNQNEYTIKVDNSKKVKVMALGSTSGANPVKTDKLKNDWSDALHKVL